MDRQSTRNTGSSAAARTCALIRRRKYAIARAWGGHCSVTGRSFGRFYRSGQPLECCIGEPMYMVRVKRGAGPGVPERTGAQPSLGISTPQFGCGSTVFSERGAARFNEGQGNESGSAAKELAGKATPASD